MNIRIDSIKECLIKGELGSGINMLIEDTKNTDYEIEGVLLAAKYNKFRKEKSLGVINPDSEEIRYNRIVIDIIEFLNEVLTKYVHDEVVYEGVKFFETPREELIKEDKRIYKKRFLSDETRHIAWELSMLIQRLKFDINFVVKWYIELPDGNFSPKYTTEFVLKKGWSNPWHSRSWGRKNYGELDKGKYKVYFEVRGKKVLEDEFYID